MALRYFNAAGGDPEGELGERHDPETHLIPLVLREALRVKQGGDPTATQLRVFGEDFDTPDGTCVRDYVHVEDLCRAHLIAIRRLLEGKVAGAEGYNLGIGRGFSVKEVIDVCRAVTGVEIRYQVESRPGRGSAQARGQRHKGARGAGVGAGVQGIGADRRDCVAVSGTGLSQADVLVPIHRLPSKPLQALMSRTKSHEF